MTLLLTFKNLKLDSTTKWYGPRGPTVSAAICPSVSILFYFMLPGTVLVLLKPIGGL